MRRLPVRALSILLAALALAGPAAARGEKAGIFDYYILSLSWPPNWCALEGDARHDDQCDPRHDFSFTLHGLWPQYNRGYPSYCPSIQRPPSRAQTAAMADVMGSGGLAWHEWNKHGRCTGLTAAAYYAKARAAYDRIVIPQVFRQLNRAVKLPAKVVEQAFIEANPGLTPEMITITCDRGRVQEARVCLTRDLEPRPCERDVSRDCRMPDALMDPVR
ncbi:ribonuclease T2 family protein [Acidimangrovimonas pyrenivorans]|uniref:Ribonuclease T n=1 Tax=Acidimangrovimonas pyrenivorans TaxID=2030798 RepID=A0ABV7AJ03_9RHOB